MLIEYKRVKWVNKPSTSRMKNLILNLRGRTGTGQYPSVITVRVEDWERKSKYENSTEQHFWNTMSRMTILDSDLSPKNIIFKKVWKFEKIYWKPQIMKNFLYTFEIFWSVQNVETFSVVQIYFYLFKNFLKIWKCLSISQ